MAGEDARGLRSAQRLAAGEGHEVGAERDEALEVLLGRQLGRGIDDQRHAVGAAHGGDGRQVGEACRVGREGHGHDRRL